jgi:hypothetical protein
MPGATKYTVYFDVHPNAKTSAAMFRGLAAPLLMHPLGWAQYTDKYKFNVVTRKPASTPRNFIHVTLTPQRDMDAMFPDFKNERLSVCNLETLEIAINEQRWLREFDDDKSELQLPAYRAYVIQHEVGHAIGKHKHETCPGPGEKTPIMLQQTKGANGCTPYPFPSSP